MSACVYFLRGGGGGAGERRFIDTLFGELVTKIMIQGCGVHD